MGSVWTKLIGQDRAAEKLRRFASTNVQSFLFVGPSGCGKEYAARAFATMLVTGSDDDSSREANLIFREEFPDVHEIYRVGAAVDKDEAENIVSQSSTTPLEAKVKVIVIHEVHLMRDSAAVRLLKTIEEPAPQVIFILLADQLVPSLTTINSRCVVVNFSMLRQEDIAATLVAEGVVSATAKSVSQACNGDLDRARLLVTDEYLARRHEYFADIASLLDGTGSAVIKIVDEIATHLEKAGEALALIHESELEKLEERVALTGERGSGRKAIADKHKRELRQLRTNELRSGLSVFANTYKNMLITNPDGDGSEDVIRAIKLIHETIKAFDLNVNENLALHALLMKCPPSKTLASTMQLN